MDITSLCCKWHLNLTGFVLEEENVSYNLDNHKYTSPGYLINSKKKKKNWMTCTYTKKMFVALKIKFIALTKIMCHCIWNQLHINSSLKFSPKFNDHICQIVFLTQGRKTIKWPTIKITWSKIKRNLERNSTAAKF